MGKPTKEQFRAYQDVQQSGITNMFAIDVVIETSAKYYDIEMTQGNCFYIMKNYSELVKEYGNGKNV